MDWFENITGFRELPYVETQQRLWIQDGKLCTDFTDRRYAIGRLETPTVADLRERVAALSVPFDRRSSVTCVQGDARQLHSDPSNGGALFQVASQFNLLEMVGPTVTPERGVTGYVHDRTQGPACAIAAGAGTIYRNYMVPVGARVGQRSGSQIDCLALLGEALGNRDEALWAMRNGYALCTDAGLKRIDETLTGASEEELDRYRSLLRVGVLWDADVTDLEPGELQVSQVFCSALPVAYSRLQRQGWQNFAKLVLEATYEATFLTAVLNGNRGASKTVFLTRVGGGAFGNEGSWIDAAIERAARAVPHHGLDVRMTSFAPVSRDLLDLAARLTRAPGVG